MEESKKKSSKGLIVFLVCVILLLVGYIVYDKVIPINGDQVQSEESESVGPKDITNSDIAKTLEETLILKDRSTGLYNKENVSSEKTDDINFIRFALASYVEANNIKLESNICGAPSEETNTYVSKDDLNAYINKTFNNSLKYDLPVFNGEDAKIYYFANHYTFESYEGKWAITCNGENDYKVYSKLTKAEEDGDYIYIYDIATNCSNFNGRNFCTNYINPDSETIVNCDYCTENNSDCKHDDICPNKTSDDYLVDVANDLLTNHADKLVTFKHTFKKSDNNYFYVSTEVQK